MKTLIKLSGIIFFFLILSSCGSSKKEDIKKIVQEWQGKEVLVPDGEITYKVLGRDTLCADLWDKPYKIFTYIDSIGCTSCQLGLPQWKALIDSCKQQQLDVSFLFAVHSSDFEYFGHEVRFNEFDYPLIYDYKNRFDKINHFPPSPYRTFLLDKNNKILLIGSPIHNPAVWALYKNVITQMQ